MSYVRKAIEIMSGYVPGEQPDESGFIKLNTNENPYPPSPRALEAMRNELDRLYLYPEATSRLVRAAASDVYGVPSQKIMATNGSDEILRILFQACAGEGDIVATFTPSYTYYKTLAAVQGASVLSIEFPDDYSLPALPDLSDVKLVLLPNPNAPSGTLMSNNSIRTLLDAAPHALVVIDEAYADFAGQSALTLLAEYENLVVTRTFSKSYGLAGLRVGLGFASETVMAQLDKVRDHYNLDRVAQAGAAAALRDQNYLTQTVTQIKSTRHRLSEALEQRGAYVWPSGANFVLARFLKHDAKRLYSQLKEQKILVRYFDAPRLDDCLRISVGSDDEIDRLLSVLDGIMK